MKKMENSALRTVEAGGYNLGTIDETFKIGDLTFAVNAHQTVGEFTGRLTKKEYDVRYWDGYWSLVGNIGSWSLNLVDRYIDTSNWYFLLKRKSA